MFISGFVDARLSTCAGGHNKHPKAKARPARVFPLDPNMERRADAAISSQGLAITHPPLPAGSSLTAPGHGPCRAKPTSPDGKFQKLP